MLPPSIRLGAQIGFENFMFDSNFVFKLEFNFKFESSNPATKFFWTFPQSLHYFKDWLPRSPHSSVVVCNSLQLLCSCSQSGDLCVPTIRAPQSVVNNGALKFKAFGPHTRYMEAADCSAVLEPENTQQGTTASGLSKILRRLKVFLGFRVLEVNLGSELSSRTLDFKIEHPLNCLLNSLNLDLNPSSTSGINFFNRNEVQTRRLSRLLWIACYLTRRHGGRFLRFLRILEWSVEPSAEIVRVGALPLCFFAHFGTEPCTLCGDCACRSAPAVRFCAFLSGLLNPLRGSCVSERFRCAFSHILELNAPSADLPLCVFAYS